MKVSKSQQAESIAQLREWIKPGQTIYTVLDHVSRSGMLRHIRLILMEPQADGTVRDIHPNYAASMALGIPQATSNGRRLDALKMRGCGMDMGFALIYELSHKLYGDGYKCLGQGKCPSNYHSNVRHHEGETERFDLVHTDGYALRHRWI